MITTYTRSDNNWIAFSQTSLQEMPQNAVWIDLPNPSLDEDRHIEQLLGIEVPTREDMRDIEPSSRLYQDNNNACVMTTSLLVGADTDQPMLTPVTFILTPKHLVTLRYAEPSSFARFARNLTRQTSHLNGSQDVFLALLDTVIDRMAEVMENHHSKLDFISKEAFRSGRPLEENEQPVDLQEVLSRLANTGNTLSKVRDSLVSIARLLSFVGPAADNWLRADNQAHIKSLLRDVRFLSEYYDSINSKINFILDATLGFIDIQTTNTVKILSVASVLFLPPTLVASVFGMNFQYIPMLHSEAGFYLGLFLIIMAGVLPYFYLKRRGL